MSAKDKNGHQMVVQNIKIGPLYHRSKDGKQEAHFEAKAVHCIQISKNGSNSQNFEQKRAFFAGMGETQQTIQVNARKNSQFEAYGKSLVWLNQSLNQKAEAKHVVVKLVNEPSSDARKKEIAEIFQKNPGEQKIEAKAQGGYTEIAQTTRKTSWTAQVVTRTSRPVQQTRFLANKDNESLRRASESIQASKTAQIQQDQVLSKIDDRNGTKTQQKQQAQVVHQVPRKIDSFETEGKTQFQSRKNSKDIATLILQREQGLKQAQFQGDVAKASQAEKGSSCIVLQRDLGMKESKLDLASSKVEKETPKIQELSYPCQTFPSVKKIQAGFERQKADTQISYFKKPETKQQKIPQIKATVHDYLKANKPAFSSQKTGSAANGASPKDSSIVVLKKDQELEEAQFQAEIPEAKEVMQQQTYHKTPFPNVKKMQAKYQMQEKQLQVSCVKAQLSTPSAARSKSPAPKVRVFYGQDFASKVDLYDSQKHKTEKQIKISESPKAVQIPAAFKTESQEVLVCEQVQTMRPRSPQVDRKWQHKRKDSRTVVLTSERVSHESEGVYLRPIKHSYSANSSRLNIEEEWNFAC